MVEANGMRAPELPLSPAAQQRLAIGVAGTILAVACILAILIALRTPQYEAQARLAYTPGISSDTAVSPAGVAPGRAAAAGRDALTDSQLAHVIDRYDLYPELRQKQSTTTLTVRLRDNLVLTEPQAGILQLSFRDADQSKTTEVTNGIASLLADSQVIQNVPMAAADPASSLRRQTRLAKKYANRPAASAVAAPAPVRPNSPASYTNSANVSELSHQLDRVDQTLRDLQDAGAELETEQRQVAAKMEALERVEHRAAESHAGNRSEAARSERSVGEQDLAVEKAKLASLRERYTDAYPDVQTTQEEIAKLQAKLAALPVASSATEKVSPTAEQAEAMGKLREEKQRVERDLGKNQATVEAEAQRKMGLLAQMQQAKYPRAFQPEMKAALPAVPASAATAQSSQTVVMQVPFLPFSIVETAGSAGLVTTSRLALSGWLAFGTILLLALCFLPILPAHYAAVVTSPEELKKTMPEHVAYLGDVGRTEP